MFCVEGINILNTQDNQIQFLCTSAGPDLIWYDDELTCMVLDRNKSREKNHGNYWYIHQQEKASLCSLFTSWLNQCLIGLQMKVSK